MNPQQPEVAEFQGFYGPFTITERLLQKIWLRGDFDASAARTTEGAPVEILFPGKWNLLEGPDFKNARLRIGGEEVTGDVELHFHLRDWHKHQHHQDPAYNNVVLHVLLFRPSAGEHAAVTQSGRSLPELALLELLHHDLEEYAAEDAIESTLERSHWQATEELVALSLGERRRLLVKHARDRWKQKVHFASIRVEKLGWEAACHQTVLEILGYRRNRGTMLNVATRFPLVSWQTNPPDEDALLQSAHWIVQGSRPANHPRQRLRQYRQMVQLIPNWPENMRRILLGRATAARAAGEEDPVPGSLRIRHNLKSLREDLCREVTGESVGGSRLDTLICDGFLPLAAAGGVEDLFSYWFSWYAGDFPHRVLQTLRTADITDRREFVTCNGYCQGVLSLSLQKRDDPLVCFEEVNRR